jgi:hypothetical protein
MSSTKCTICGIRFAKLFTPPRCRQCVTGHGPGRKPSAMNHRALVRRGEVPKRRPGRPPGIPQPDVCRVGTLRGELHVLRRDGHQRPDDDYSEAEIERRFTAALREIRARKEQAA